MTKAAAIIIGAGGSIGTALCQQWQRDENISQLFAISRKHVAAPEHNTNTAIQNIQCD